MFACIDNPGQEEPRTLMDCAHAFSPLVEETAEGTVVLDIEACELLFGSLRQIAQEIARHAVALGLKVNVAVAQNPDAAIHAAKFFRGITDWWCENGWARDEWDVAVVEKKEETLYRIYHDLKSDAWFMEGVYD